MKMRTYWENERRKLLGQPLIQDTDNQENTAIDAPLGAVLAQGASEGNYDDDDTMTIETYTEEGAFGGIGNRTTGVLTATLYFVFDRDVLQDLQNRNIDPVAALQTYITNFQTSVVSVWTTFQFNGVQVSLAGVTFSPLNNTMDIGNPTHNLFVVGNGASDPKVDGNRVSYVATGRLELNNPPITNAPNTWGYFYYETTTNVSYAAHEFGHIFGLTDRYHEGVIQERVLVNPGVPSDRRFTTASVGGRVTAPMHLAFSIDPGYNPLDNLYSNNQPTITQMQLNIVFDINRRENTYPTVVWVRLFTTPPPPIPVIGINNNEAFIAREDPSSNAWVLTTAQPLYYGGKGTRIIPSSRTATLLLEGQSNQNGNPNGNVRGRANRTAILNRRGR